MAATVAKRVARLQKRAGHLVSPVGFARLGKEPVVVRRPATEQWDWVVLRLENDPLYQSKSLAIPAHARARIKAVAATGVEFDRLLIAHEVPKIDTLPAEYTEKKGWQLDLVEKTALARPEKAAAGLDKAIEKVRGAAAATGSVLGAIAMAPIGLAADPVLMGAIVVSSDEDGEDLVIFEIARWRF